MKLTFLGLPGAGKGTQSAIVSEKLGIPTIATGRILREAISEGTEVGLEAKTFVESGLLVPDLIIIGILNERLAKSVKAFYIRGPRTCTGISGRTVSWMQSYLISDDEILER